MRKLWLGILATLLVVVFVAPSFAWEFSMTGEFEYRLRYFGRTGDTDLFGQKSMQDSSTAIYNSFEVAPAAMSIAAPEFPAGTARGYFMGGRIPLAQNSNYVGFAGPNYYGNGWRNPAVALGSLAITGAAPIISDSAADSRVAITRGGFSRWGSDALYNDWRMTFVPSIRVNNAIRLHGVYTIGGLRNKYAQNSYDALGNASAGSAPYERYYMSQTNEGAYNTAAVGSWEQFRATVQLPIATLSIGSKDFPFGTGANFAENTVSNSFLMVLPYGPFRFLPALWLARNRIGAASFETVPDKDRKANFFGGFLVTYENGPAWIGLAWIGEWRHAHRQTDNDLATPFFRSQDFNAQTWGASGKYNNGRFFLNAEYVFGTQDTYRSGAVDAALRSRQTNAELYNAFAEGGVMFGPSKLSLMWTQSSGPVLNNSNTTDFANDYVGGRRFYGKVYAANPINYQVLLPYSYLMFPMYGGGNDTFNPDGTGQLSDGLVLAARLDYAAAANLNIFGTYMWARRLETAGYWAGGKLCAFNVNAPTGVGAADYAIAPSTTIATAQAWKNTALGGGYNPAGLNPYPDDNFIGWEAQLGVDWKLLENMSWQTKYAYWAPGQWFDTAYRAFAINTAIGQQGQGAVFGRDAIQAIHTSLTINF